MEKIELAFSTTIAIAAVILVGFIINSCRVDSRIQSDCQMACDIYRSRIIVKPSSQLSLRPGEVGNEL
jgi:hypothetical protein